MGSMRTMSPGWYTGPEKLKQHMHLSWLGLALFPLFPEELLAVTLAVKTILDASYYLETT